MRTIRHLIEAAAVLAAASTFAASVAAATAPASAPASAAPVVGPGMGMGPGMGPGPGARQGMHYRWNDRNSPGWSMMTAQERQEHQTRMSSFTSYDECKAYLDQHHQDMMARASSRGRTLPAHPPYDACARLKSSR